jgi:hypothetical protein
MLQKPSGQNQFQLSLVFEHLLEYFRLINATNRSINAVILIHVTIWIYWSHPELLVIISV